MNADSPSSSAISGSPEGVPAGFGAEDETLSLGRPEVEPVSRSAGQDGGSHRDDLEIPDYRLLKRIGAGAYGEVWLAQSITGALRAVKIVWREDFELTRTFHREFEGIQQFEPISRGHPCLMHILHVGWNEHRGFYYYVMELADDAEKGAQIDDLVTYTARTLSSDLKRNGRLDLHFCREAGIYLADALQYMHEHGLTHRDIKPSNIIFVGGICKLADIGLVAASGERSFVGTEGFVPPEGPGTPVADIYSLGKVLYEMSSGLDRMEFPEVPADLTEEEAPMWMDMNRVICRACAPDLKERFSSAAELGEALQTQVGVKRREPLLRRMTQAGVPLVVGSALAAGMLVMGMQQRGWEYTVAAPGRAGVKAEQPAPRPPEEGRPWRSRFGRWFSFQKDRHVCDVPLEYEVYNRFLETTLRPFEGDVAGYKAAGNRHLNIVVIRPEDADAFCAWETETERRAGYLDADHEVAWRPFRLDAEGASARAGLTAVRCQVVRVETGGLRVESVPEGAEVYLSGRSVGVTPLELDAVRAGAFELELRRPGFASLEAAGNIAPGETTKLALRLRANGAVVFDEPWKNSLGMELVPLGRVLLGATEVRALDFSRFESATGRSAVAGRDLTKTPTAAVSRVSRADADEFCDWLTGVERKKGLLDETQSYRLPTDDEWSMAAYLPRERGATPAERSLRIDGIYPWGFIWPPYAKQGNFSDASRKKVVKGAPAIPKYDDGQAGVAPVASYRKDSRGLYDLSGNVWEWVADAWQPGSSDGVVRGGSFTTDDRQELLASFRLQLPAADRREDVGFRVVLAPDGVMAREEE
ncbi:MAG: SUMF1/EgtB/PvdO family nonheme iron enzyme [Verrucomicrobiales bacterium]|nr:SUMF1/EgtB/PvdO family nonheme iron enzyme [Verrucomicrobiales bacterium]